MSFKVDQSDGEARAGVLTLPNGKNISTPAMLIYTRRGGPLNLTPDLLDTLKAEVQAIQFNVFSFIGSTFIINKFPGSAREYLAINPEFAIVATSRDPAIFEFQGALRQATNDAVSVTTHTGATTVTPEQYTTAAAALQPDLILALSDEIPADAKRNRAAAAVDRTLAWLPRCLSTLASIHPNPFPAVLACVQGGQHVDHRERCATSLIPFLPDLAGVCIGGLGLGESPEQRKEIIKVSLKNLPANKVRMASGIGSPEEILAAVEQGIDIFDVAYIADVTAGGYALDFPTELDNIASNGIKNSKTSADEATLSGSDDTKMNLWATAYRTDALPLVPGCTCVACKAHTRAYIHHLLQTHEMTAQVLLEIHNTAHYLRFFSGVRKAVAVGKLREFREQLLARKERWLMAVGG